MSEQPSHFLAFGDYVVTRNECQLTPYLTLSHTKLHMKPTTRGENRECGVRYSKRVLYYD